MIDKRLLGLVEGSMKYILLTVLMQWVMLGVNIIFMYAIAITLHYLYLQISNSFIIYLVVGLAIGAVILRYICTREASNFSIKASEKVKKVLRERIYRKLLVLGNDYQKNVNTAEIIQTAVEGVDQLETYFGAYMPQFFYAMLAPLTLLIVLLFVDAKVAIILFVCVPLIPVSIILVQRWAKKLLSKYWGQYTEMGDNFLENLQGLTTLKIYQADEHQNEVMNIQAENFRKITMRVLIMQLNSISVMDLVAYGGAALGMIIAILDLKSGRVPLYGAILIILLSAEFFLPMRQLGSFFHIAMNGMAAADKIFDFLDIEERSRGSVKEVEGRNISFDHVSFNYEEDRDILKSISFNVNENELVAIVGESGSGKSTIARILCKEETDYKGNIKIGEIELRDIERETLLNHITYIGSNAYIFKGTVKDNLLLGKEEANEEELWKVLEEVNLSDFVRSEGGLDLEIKEKGSNLSGGQCQRLAIARALLHDSPIYIFDEATSNIDVESENDIMKKINELSNTKTIILISHRLANVVNADKIYVLDNGSVVQEGSHEELINHPGIFKRLWDEQMSLENYGKENTYEEK